MNRINSTPAKHEIEVWTYPGVLLELYRYVPGPPERLEKHCHDDYQLGLSLDTPGRYSYRRERYVVPVGGLNIIHPGELHDVHDVDHRYGPATYAMMYVAPAAMAAAASELGRSGMPLPFFDSPIVQDEGLARLFLRSHQAFCTEHTDLQRDTLLLELLTLLIERNADGGAPRREYSKESDAVRRTRRYLEENYTRNISLKDLANLAGLSPYHLNRVFRAEVGIPPHQYQIQARVLKAKALLAGGAAISDAAQRVGFADQSHLTRQFKRFLNTTPGRYRTRK